jgi:hypothetical protein
MIKMQKAMDEVLVLNISSNKQQNVRSGGLKLK